jgi:exosortase/archaeosortase family protein
MQPSKRANVIAALIVATWPVWRWMTLRFADGSGDMWELLAAVTAVGVLIRDRTRELAGTLVVPTVMLLIYAAAYNFLSPLPRAMLAMAVIGTAVSALWYGRRVDVPVCGLLLISLPVMASLNFYLGYPMRVAAGTITEALLQMNGIAAIRDGAQLQWNGQSIAIDAPCSGVKMLWTGAYLCLALSAVMRLPALRTIALALLSIVVVIAANAIRATSLFYVEAGLLAGPAFLHEAIGLVMFAFAAGVILVLSRKLADYRHAH